MRIVSGGPRLAAAGLIALLVNACSRPAEAPAAKPAPPPVLTLPAPEPSPVLDRADILRAVGQAASAYAAGRAYPDALAKLAGQRFRIAAPFGCDGPGSPDAPMGYSVDRSGRSVTLTVRPVRWSGEAWTRTFTDDAAVEALEGFWIRRPWLAGSACPGKVPVQPGARPSRETVGLVRVFEAGGSRLQRRGERPYQTTLKTEPGAPPALAGFQLVVEGRIAEAAGRPIRCRSGSPDQRPVCLVSIELERVTMEDGRGETLAEWRE